MLKRTMDIANFSRLAQQSCELQANNASIDLVSHIVRFNWMKCIESTRNSGIYFGLLDEIEPVEVGTFIDAYLTWYDRLRNCDDGLMASVVRTGDSIQLTVVNYNDDRQHLYDFFIARWAIGSTEYDVDSFVETIEVDYESGMEDDSLFRP